MAGESEERNWKGGISVIAFNRSPGDLLANDFFERVSPATLTILTGPSGSGKSSYCLRLFRRASALGLHPQGLISLPVLEANRKIGIDLLDLSSGTRRRLAVRRGKGIGGVATEDWQFDPLTLQWGNQILARIRNSSLVIIDELGPLEFYHREGWQAAFTLVEKRAYHWAVVVVRPALLSLALAGWSWAEVLQISEGQNDPS